jgi:hypothetical protein
MLQVEESQSIVKVNESTPIEELIKEVSEKAELPEYMAKELLDNFLPKIEISDLEIIFGDNKRFNFWCNIVRHTRKKKGVDTAAMEAFFAVIQEYKFNKLAEIKERKSNENGDV